MINEKDSELFRKIGEKINCTDVVNQNANIDEHSFGGRLGEATSIIMKQYALNFCMSEKTRNNHLNNEIYIHDLDHYAIGDHNCLSIPIDRLLAEGFTTKQTDIRPANSISTAMQLVAVIFQCQSLNQFGGVSATHLDWSMIPYVRKSFAKHYKDGLKYIARIDDIDCEIVNMLDNAKDWSIDDSEYIAYNKNVYDYAIDMVTKETYQACEGLFHNLNSLQSRSGCQLPFSSINFGTCTKPEGRLVIKALLDTSIKGVGKFHKTPIFPCSIFQLMKGVNEREGDPNYDLFKLALKSTALRLYPNYANCDWSGNAGYDKDDPSTYFSSMGCRTINGFDINADPGVNPQTKDGRGNICPTTIILPTLAMEARKEVLNELAGCLVPQSVEWLQHKNIDKFLSILSTKIEEAKDSLIERYEYICSQSPQSARFMYDNRLIEGFDEKEGIRSAMKHGTLAIGLIGLAETLELLVGENQLHKKGMKLAKQICSLFRTKCDEYKYTYKLNFSVYYTPAENLCYTSMQKFKEKYGVIPKVSDKEFFTNSIHVPVWEPIDPFTKINVESQLTGYSNGGCITYVEFDAAAKYNLESLETIVIYAMEHDIPYFAINVPNDICDDCGYRDVINDACPQCGSTNITRLRRVAGYLTRDYKTTFNKGKQQETEMRYKHSNRLAQWKTS